MNIQGDKILSLMNDEEYEAYKEMIYLRSQLISPPPMVIPFVSVKAVDMKTGEVAGKSEGMMNTWLRNYSNMFAAMVCGLQATGTGIFGAGHLNTKNTSGTIGADVIFATVQAAFGDSDVGITIGRGPAAYSYEDFVLDNPIAHGVGMNEMQHYDMFDHVQTWDVGPPREWTTIAKRYFVNRSGGSITVTETGYGDDARLWSRDVLAPSVAIDDLKACKVEYTFVSATWPS